MKKVTHLPDGCVDTVTGEFTPYEVVPYITSNDVIQSRHFYEARDVEELFEIVGRYKEKRYSNVMYSLDRDKLGVLYIPVLQLCSKVSYFNVGFYDRDFLCSAFSVSNSNLNKTLNKLVKVGLMRYSGIGLTASKQIRIIWNPISVWKGWEFSVTRTTCIQNWYAGLFTKMEDVDIGVLKDSDVTLDIPEAVAVMSPDPYISPYFNYERKDKFKVLMDISDADFELMLLGVLPFSEVYNRCST